CGLVAVTVTPGSAPPCGSVTVPIKAPVVRDVCASAPSGNSSAAASASTNGVKRFDFFIHWPPLRIWQGRPSAEFSPLLALSAIVICNKFVLRRIDFAVRRIELELNE